MIAALANHLWQSTLFAVGAGLLALALRRNHARMRYAIWLAASTKFLIPFAWLIEIGTHFAWRRSSAQPPLVVAIEQFSLPYTPVRQTIAASMPSAATPNLLLASLLGLWLLGVISVMAFGWIRWRRTASIIRVARPLFAGREVDALERVGADLPIVSSNAPLEPGVFGIWRPVLFWPAGISEHLSDSQLEGILAHEATHAWRRDNLTAAIHMLVEALFWFHPLVWWIGARLVAERENACDEAVLCSQTQPRAYAEGILKVCEYCLEAPLLCVSGVSGADLKRRIQSIVANRTARDLGFARKLLLAVAGIAALAAPIAIGLLNAPAGQAQTEKVALPQVEVASIKPAAPDQRGIRIRPGANGGIDIDNMPLKELITFAWRIQSFQISGAPAWIDSARYDISAKPEHRLKPDEIPLFLQALLADRFQLKTHHETKELPIYALVRANKDGKLGPQLKEPKEGGCTAFDPTKPPPPPDPGKPPVLGCGGMWMGPDRMGAASVDLAMLTPSLARILGRTVVDKTDLTGKFDIQLQWTPDQNQLLQSLPGGPPPDVPLHIDPNGPSLFTALQEQLGLKLESQKGPVDILVIDHVERPSEN